MREVADFYLGIQRKVEAAGIRDFPDIEDTWRQLQQLDVVFEHPGNFWVARTETAHLIGCVGLQSLGGGEGMVGRFGVDDAYRRQGVGTSLLDRLLQWARAESFESLTLETNAQQNGLPIYQRAGFIDTGRLADDGDMIMRLVL